MSNGKLEEIILDDYTPDEIKSDKKKIEEISLDDINEILDLKKLERAAIVKALFLTNWRQNEAARLLNISSRVLNYKITAYKITSPTWRVNK